MKKVIFKYSLSGRSIPELNLNPIGAPFKIKMPKSAVILTVQTQNEPDEINNIQTIGRIWAMLNAGDEETVERTFFIAGTGKSFEMPKLANYIGTYQFFGGSLVWHLFEIIEL